MDNNRLEMLSSGKLKLTTIFNSAVVGTAISNVGVAIDRWSFIELRFAESFAKLALGPSPDQLDAAFTTYVSGTFSTITSPVEVGRNFVGLLDDLDFVKGGFKPEGLAAIGLNPDATIVTDANGRAVFFVAATSVTVDYRPVVYEITIYGSPQKKAKVSTVPSTIWGDMVALGRAFLLGDESLGEDPSWFQRAAAWAGEMLPFVSSLRTLGFEIYKAATGCDEVSWLNVTFSAVGLVADIATFGTAGTAIRASQTLLRATFKTLLKETVRNAVTDLAFRGAIEGFVRLATVEVMETDGTTSTQAAPWVVATEAYLTKIRMLLLSDELREIVNDAFRSSDDLFIGLKFFQDYGANELERTFSIGKEVQQDLQLANNDISIPTMAEGGATDLLAFDLSNSVAPLEIGTLARPPTFSPPLSRPAVKTMFPRTQRARETLTLMARGIPGVSSTDRKALDGLRRLTKMVIKGARNDETARALAMRIRRGINELLDGSKKKFLEDFEDLYQLGRSDGDLLKKVQNLARDFAARGPSREVRRGRTKGAAYAIQEAREGLRSGKLRGADAIEPPAANDNRLYRDLLEQPLGGQKSYVELKAVENLASQSNIDKLGTQMYSHFRRQKGAGITNINDLIQLEIRHLGAAPPLKAQNKVRSRAIAAIIKQLHFPREEAVKWAKDNIKFATKNLNYRLR